MIIVAGTVAVPPDRHEALAAAIAEITSPTRAEDGCLEFAFWADLEQRGRFHVFELWAAPEHLAAHRATPHLLAFRDARARLRAVAAVRYYAAEELPPA